MAETIQYTCRRCSSIFSFIPAGAPSAIILYNPAVIAYSEADYGALSPAGAALFSLPNAL
jgi:hypothetical protein